MSIYRRLSTTYKGLVCTLFLVSCFAVTAQAVPVQQSREQVEQLDQIVDLDVSQKREIQNLLDNSKAKTDELRTEIDKLQRALNEEIGPDFNERAIRENAEKLGEVSGELTAETALLQARIQNTLTEKQLGLLVERLQRAQQMQQQMQELQQQQGMQQAPR